MYHFLLVPATPALFVLVVLLIVALSCLGFVGPLASIDRALLGVTAACFSWCLPMLSQRLPR